MDRSRRVFAEFNGVALDAHPAKLGDGLFQVDEGGDRSDRGVWRVRRGYRHTTIPKQSAAITSIIGFELPGSGFGVVVVAGTSAFGFTGVAQQGDTVVSGTGFGEGGFGDGGFGG